MRARVVILEVQLAQPLQHLWSEFASRLACQRLGEQAAGHADLAVQPPHRHLDALFLQGIVPGQHMVVDAVHQRAVEIEQVGRLLPRLDHVGIPFDGGLAGIGWPRGRGSRRRGHLRAQLLAQHVDGHEVRPLFHMPEGPAIAGFRTLNMCTDLVDGT